MEVRDRFWYYLICVCYMLFPIKVVFGTSVNVGSGTSAMERSTVTLRCSFSKQNPNVESEPIVHWSLLDDNGSPQPILTKTNSVTHREPNFSRFSISGEADLKISNAQAQDNGIYRCRVQILGDLPNEDFGDLSLKVYWISKAVSTIPANGVVVGYNATLTCTATGDLLPSVYWTKDDKELSLSSRNHVIRNDHTLIIFQVTRADDGFYVCGARNNVREETSIPQRLEIYYAPVINDIGDIKTVINQNVTVTFEVDSNPPATLTWTKDGQVVEGMTSTSFTFSVAEEEVGKSYSIQLTASNSVGHMTKNTSVIIGDACGYATVSDKKTGHFVEGGSLSIKEGKSITLLCSVKECESADSYSYDWYKNNAHHSTSNEISINNVDLITDDNIEYMCRVRGGIPSPSTVSFRIQVKVPLLEPLTIVIICGSAFGFIILILVFISCVVFWKKHRRLRGYKTTDATMKSGFSYNDIEIAGIKEKDDSSSTTSGIGPDILEQSRVKSKKAYKSKAVDL